MANHKSQKLYKDLDQKIQNHSLKYLNFHKTFNFLKHKNKKLTKCGTTIFTKKNYTEANLKK